MDEPAEGSSFHPITELGLSRWTRLWGLISIVSVQPLVDAWGVPIQMKDPKTQKLGGWRNMFMSKTTAVGRD
ncbi:hypothetical protein GYMLUDRAFT_49538 [Collybiopsis luxurians FD-317 M1]|uniref:Uncharacterized protein n=1 Tax=Collybiopsis luxurians FD-317 M1 TaxID=944289 RepID=A0A0D0CE11_9AGAR|nr:hypothetical protein GYMLUDRAFT_49538 [Collybiopsis luxurians FD-317 M1]